jgi:hypothetical protein
MKLKGFHFDTMKVIEAESQAVLTTLTELDFQDGIKKLVFEETAAPVPEIMNDSLFF